MNRRKLSAGLVVGAMALLGLGVTGGVASAAPKALPVESTFTLPLPIPLLVTVSTGAGGAITDVSVDPADTAITATKARPNRVAFTVDETGVKVSVKSKGQTQSVSARAGSLAEISGAGGWTGDVFGDGIITEVAFTVGEAAGAPTIDITNTGGGEKSATEVKTDDDGEVSARASILFTNKTTFQTRTLSIRVKVENESDDDDDDDSPETHASVRITLGKLRGLAGAPAGAKTWTGLLCDGTTGTINYTVGTEGISAVAALVGPTAVDARIDVEGNKAEVRFPTGERVKISVKADGVGFTINVSEKIRCRDAEAPTVNGVEVPVTDDSVDDDHGDDHGGDHQGGDDKKSDDHGGGHGGDDKKSDD